MAVTPATAGTLSTRNANGTRATDPAESATILRRRSDRTSFSASLESEYAPAYTLYHVASVSPIGTSEIVGDGITEPWRFNSKLAPSAVFAARISTENGVAVAESAGFTGVTTAAALRAAAIESFLTESTGGATATGVAFAAALDR